MVSTMLVLRVLLALTCVVGLIWFIGRRFGGGQPQRSSREHVVKLVGRQSVGRHTGVAVVAVGNRRLLLGYGDQQVTLITELGPVVDAPPALTAEHTATLPAQRPAPALESVAESAPPALQGSILAPETWRQAVRTLQDRTVRR